MVAAWFGLHGVAQGREIVRMYRSAYHLGLGDAGVATSQGADAVFYNPAGMATSSSLVSEVSILSPQVEFARSSEDLLRKAQSGKDTLDLAASATGKQQYFALQNYSGVLFNRAGMGVFQRGQVDAFVGTDPASGLPRASVGAVTHIGAHLSYAMPVGEELFLGASAKLVQKTQARVDLDAVRAQELGSAGTKERLEEALERGVGLGVDVGAIYRAQSDTPVSIGVVARNLGLSYQWFGDDAGSLPDAEPVLVDLGIGIEPETRKSRLRLVMDLRDVTDEMKESIYKRVHIGAELSFRDMVGGTVGLNQGYLCYGGYLGLRIVRLEAGVFSEEFGDYPGHMQGKRAYVRLGIGWTK